MSLELPTKEQMLYSELAIVDALACCIRDNCASGGLFEDEELSNHFEMCCTAIRAAHYRMKWLIKKNQEPKSVCY